MSAEALTNDPFAGLDVFYGELTVNRAFVYARLPVSAATAGLTLTGHVRGPRCAISQTLPSTAPLVDLGAGPTHLARALVTDPSFWSPDLPAIYDVVIELRRGAEVVAQAKRELGFRPISVRGKWILREEKPWVVRGVFNSSTHETDIRAWKEAGAALLEGIGDSCDYSDASRLGVAVFAGVPSGSFAFEYHTRSFVAQPAVTFFWNSGATMGEDAIMAEVAKNVVLTQCFQPDDLHPVAAAWAKVVFLDATDRRRFAEMAATMDRPVIAMRQLEIQTSVAEARAACDELQRDLAPFGQYAGYIV